MNAQEQQLMRWLCAGFAQPLNSLEHTRLLHFGTNGNISIDLTVDDD